ncbi:MAG: GtrA family protein [Rhodospirillales bacterium]|nr:GtrA family protein [Rhodospirillales bacterium]MDE2198951.1 GtrA family protein [Rhodospirillales bacterium]MDE2575059.1 GtrA family protein [Rhodospirillales bacterium]
MGAMPVFLAAPRRQRLFETLRYGCVGLLVVGIEYATYLAGLRVLPPVESHLAARGIAAVAGYFGHARFTFRHGGRQRGSALRYAAIAGINMAASAGLLVLFLRGLGPVYGKMAADAVAIVAAYLATRSFVFGMHLRRADC